MEAEGSVPSGIAIGKGFINLSMEMEALQERCPASSVSGKREQEVERRTKERSLPSHPYSLALDHLLHLGGKKVLHRRFSPLPFLSWLRRSRLRSLLAAAIPPPGFFKAASFGAAGSRSRESGTSTTEEIVPPEAAT
jgi:hypothetical protein